MVKGMIRAVLKKFVRDYIDFFTKELPHSETEFNSYYSIITSEWFAIKKDVKQHGIQNSQQLFHLLDDLFEKSGELYYQLIGSTSSYFALKNSQNVRSRWGEIQRVAKTVLNGCVELVFS